MLFWANSDSLRSFPSSKLTIEEGRDSYGNIDNLQKVDLPIPRINSKIDNAGYFNLINEHYLQQQTRQTQQQQQEYSADAMKPRQQDKRAADNIKSGDTSSMGSDSRRSIILQRRDSNQFVNISETVRSIVDEDIYWSQIRQKIKDAKVITSLGVHEACVEFVNDKKEEMQKKRLEVADRRISKKLTKLRKRLSIFG